MEIIRPSLVNMGASTALKGSNIVGIVSILKLKVKVGWLAM